MAPNAPQILLDVSFLDAKAQDSCERICRGKACIVAVTEDAERLRETNCDASTPAY
jgi:hypothetical protein